MLSPQNYTNRERIYTIGAGKQLFTEIKVNNTDIKVLLDTGAGISILEQSLIQNFMSEPIDFRVVTATGDPIRLTGRSRIKLQIGLLFIEFNVLVASDIQPGLFILGNDILGPYDFEIDYKSRTWSLRGSRKLHFEFANKHSVSRCWFVLDSPETSHAFCDPADSSSRVTLARHSEIETVDEKELPKEHERVTLSHAATESHTAMNTPVRSNLHAAKTTHHTFVMSNLHAATTTSHTPVMSSLHAAQATSSEGTRVSQVGCCPIIEMSGSLPRQIAHNLTGRGLCEPDAHPLGLECESFESLRSDSDKLRPPITSCGSDSDKLRPPSRSDSDKPSPPITLCHLCALDLKDMSDKPKVSGQVLTNAYQAPSMKKMRSHNDRKVKPFEAIASVMDVAASPEIRREAILTSTVCLEPNSRTLIPISLLFTIGKIKPKGSHRSFKSKTWVIQPMEIAEIKYGVLFTPSIIQNDKGYMDVCN